MSSIISQTQAPRWGFYELRGPIAFEGLEDGYPESSLDPASIWDSTAKCPGVEIKGHILCIEPGTWRLRVSAGEAFGSMDLGLVIKTSGKQTNVTIKSVNKDELDRTDLTGVLTILKLTQKSEVQISASPLINRKGGIIYPLNFYIERLT